MAHSYTLQYLARQIDGADGQGGKWIGNLLADARFFGIAYTGRYDDTCGVTAIQFADGKEHLTWIVGGSYRYYKCNKDD